MREDEMKRNASRRSREDITVSKNESFDASRATSEISKEKYSTPVKQKDS